MLLKLAQTNFFALNYDFEVTTNCTRQWLEKVPHIDWFPANLAFTVLSGWISNTTRCPEMRVSLYNCQVANAIFAMGGIEQLSVSVLLS